MLIASLEDCIKFSNLYAPEHLIIATAKTNEVADRITNANSVFLENLNPVSVGDYTSVTNHTLLTNKAAVTYIGIP